MHKWMVHMQSSHPQKNLDDQNPTQRSIRLVIADDRVPAREGLKALLAAPDPEIAHRLWDQECLPIQVVGEANDGLQAVQLANLLHPDVIIMDVRMPGMDGIQATRLIKTGCKNVGVIILTFYGAHREDAIQAGADAYLLKGCPPETLIECLIKIGLKMGDD
jgi:DNA-binding NarL/FixJ family response regulator